MNFITAIKLCFIRYAQFSGRASRSEFWFFVLFGILGSWIAIIIDTMILNYSWEKDGPVYLIFQIIILIPSIAVVVFADKIPLMCVLPFVAPPLSRSG